MGYKIDDKCIQKAFPDERLFVLMARDCTSPEVVIEWIKLNISIQPIEKLHEALEAAYEMSKTYETMLERKETVEKEFGNDYVITPKIRENDK